MLLGREGCRIKPPDGMAWANSAGGGVDRAAGGERLRKERLTLSISQGEQERGFPPPFNGYFRAHHHPTEPLSAEKKTGVQYGKVWLWGFADSLG